MATTNRNRAFLRAAFNSAVRLGHVDATPFNRGTKAVVKLSQEISRRRRLEADESERLHRLCRNEIVTWSVTPGRVFSWMMAADRSEIEWTESTWNPTSGCTKVSPGCDRCYAERITQRFPNTFPNGFTLTLRPDTLETPLHWKRPRLIFVNSMSDLFHADVPEEYLRQVFDVMVRTPQHTYQVLTKRAARLARLAPRLPWPPNVWMGVSVESPAFRWRIDSLRRVPAVVRFVSAEPLLAPLPDLDLSGIHWLIAGGESQYGCRAADLGWFRSLRDQCAARGVAFFLKQLGGHPSKRGGDAAAIDGRRWIELPVVSGSR